MVWPVWDGWLDLDAVSDLLDLPELVAEPPRVADEPRVAELAPRGVAEVFRCARLHVGKYMSFSPARPLWGVRGVGGA
jgi:hypothetical protein